MVIVKASFAHHWRGNFYQKDEPMPADTIQAERLTRCGQAYYSVESKPAPELEIDFQDLPEYELLEGAGYDSLDAVGRATDEQLLQITGIGPKTVERIRGFYAGDRD